MRARTIARNAAVIATTVGVVAAGACDSAVARPRELGAFNTLSGDTILRAGSLGSALIAPLALLRAGDSLIVSDAITNELVALQLHDRTLRRVGDRHYRPAAPLFLDIVDDSTMLAARPQLLELVSLRTGQRTRIPIPESPWGDTAVGPIRAHDGWALMAPGAAGIFYTTLARKDHSSSHSIVSFAIRGRVNRAERLTFGDSIPEHARRYGASLEHWTAIAGWRGDSVVLVNLYAALVQVWAGSPQAGYQPARTLQLPLGFIPRPTVETPTPSRNVQAQPQLRDALLLPDGNLWVLRYISYDWDSSWPWRRTGGAYSGRLGVELYSLGGRRIGGAELHGSWWRGLAATGDGGIYVFGTGDGRSSNLPVVLRFQAP